MRKYGTIGAGGNFTSPSDSPKKSVVIRKLTEWKDRINWKSAECSGLKKNQTGATPALSDGRQKDVSEKKIARVDKTGIISYYVVVGAIIDVISGLGATGIAVARSVSVAANSTKLGKWYGVWREKVYRWAGTTEESTKARKYFTELIAYIPFRTPVYTVSNMIGNIVQEGKPDLAKALVGTALFLLYAPLAAPILGAWIDALRKFFGIKTAAEGAYGKKEGEVPLPAIAKEQAVHGRNTILAWADGIPERFAGMVQKIDVSKVLARAAFALQISVVVIYAASILSALSEFTFSSKPQKATNPIEQVIESGNDKHEMDIAYFTNIS